MAQTVAHRANQGLEAGQEVGKTLHRETGVSKDTVLPLFTCACVARHLKLPGKEAKHGGQVPDMTRVLLT